ncbi:MAG: DUF2726 domain-containing protein [Chitinophagaceae bacterium]|nr:DUF2726 domain-containing protein [Rubrivivax sp.]
MQQLLPWILASLSAALLLGAGILSWLNRRRPQSRPLPNEWTLTARPVFSSDERRVYRQLREALPHHIVLSKLPLVRFCQPVDPQEVRFWYELLGSVNVTFAVCSANGRVLAAIDLDSERGHSRRSTQIKQSVLAACRVRYLRCQADQLPSIPELQLLVPQSATGSRGPQAPPAGSTRDMAAGSAASRRRERERKTLWQDSGFLQDSFFGVDGRGDLGPVSGFGSLRSGMSGRDMPVAPDDAGGVVIETPISPLRH